MFTELPKLFDRNFAMGFFLPVALFATLSILICEQYGVATIVLSLAQQDILLGTTLIGLLSWIGGILLLATNRDIYRLLEGYGRFNPLWLLGWVQKRKYTLLQQKIEKLDDEYLNYQKRKEEFPSNLRNQRNKLLRELAESYPDDVQWILPTAFGNTLRAFEVYPRIMYGMEAIDGWSRLLTVIPSDYREIIDNAKAQVDFWLNLGILSLLLIAEYLVLAFTNQTFLVLWFPILCITLSYIATYRARRNAVEWGDLVKSAFDVYRFDLLDALRIDEPSNREKEKAIWRRYSQAIIYRTPSIMPELKKQAKKQAK